jgi:ABC-2 type transport system ATP-binding protein
MSIQVTNLYKTYGQQVAVNAINFELGQGEIVGFLGPNGAGKSTTMKMITGYLSPTQGQVNVCGVNVSQQPNLAKKHIGYLPESNALYYEMFVMEYLEMVAKFYNINGSQPIKEAIEKVGLKPEFTKKIGQLSKGYKQRVGIAAALIHNPSVLILDEPTSGLDPNQIIEIRNVIKEVGKEKTVLFSSHIMQEVEAVCNRVIIINKGDILADDSLANITNRKNNNKLIIKFAKPINPETFSSIKACQKLDDFTLSFTDNNLDVLKRQVMQMALDAQLDIVSMQNQQENLESIFRTLTLK